MERLRMQSQLSWLCIGVSVFKNNFKGYRRQSLTKQMMSSAAYKRLSIFWRGGGDWAYNYIYPRGHDICHFLPLTMPTWCTNYQQFNCSKISFKKKSLTLKKNKHLTENFDLKTFDGHFYNMYLGKCSTTLHNIVLALTIIVQEYWNHYQINILPRM